MLVLWVLNLEEKIMTLKEINNGQLGWFEITYLNNKLRICKGNKGTLFILRKINLSTYSRILRNLLKLLKM